SDAVLMPNARAKSSTMLNGRLDCPFSRFNTAVRLTCACSARARVLQFPFARNATTLATRRSNGSEDWDARSGTQKVLLRKTPYWYSWRHNGHPFPGSQPVFITAPGLVQHLHPSLV